MSNVRKPKRLSAAEKRKASIDDLIKNAQAWFDWYHTYGGDRLFAAAYSIRLDALRDAKATLSEK